MSEYFYASSPCPHPYPGSPPPAAPLHLTPLIATNPHTNPQILWYIAEHCPDLRYWLIANLRASPELLECVSQAGGPRVKESFEILFGDSVAEHTV
ncbi:variant leucine-rich repeat-containing protein [Alloscardovia criceti]